MNNSKYKLAICELYNTNYHGYTNNSYKFINNNFLIQFIFTIEAFYHNEHNSCVEFLQRNIYHGEHPIIRNYKKISSNKNYIKLDIVQDYYLSGNEHIAIIKTFWLKIFQRIWKKFYKNRKQLIKFYSNPKQLMKREINGKNISNYFF
jgi:hypothetical protein